MDDTIKMPDPMLQSTEMLAICKRAMDYARIDYDKLEDGPVPGLCKALIQLVVAETHKFMLAKMTYIELYRTANAEDVTMDPTTVPRKALQLSNFIAELGLIAVAARVVLEGRVEDAKERASKCPGSAVDPNHWLAHLDTPSSILMHRFREFDKTQAMEVERPAHAYSQDQGRA